MTVTVQVKILDREMKQNEARYVLDRKAAKISALSPGNLDKYEYLTVLDLNYKRSTVEQAKFYYYLLIRFLKPWSTHCFLNFLRKRSQFRCTGLLCSSKLVHLGGKNLTCFIQNLVHNLMNLVLSSKSNRKW